VLDKAGGCLDRGMLFSVIETDESLKLLRHYGTAETADIINYYDIRSYSTKK